MTSKMNPNLYLAKKSKTPLRYPGGKSKATKFLFADENMPINKIYPQNLSEKEMGYLIGFYVGDGYSYFRKDKHYVVEFYLNSMRICRLIKLRNIVNLL